MTEIVALESRKADGKVAITDSKGLITQSNNVEELLSSLVAPYEDYIKVVWDR